MYLAADFPHAAAPAVISAGNPAQSRAKLERLLAQLPPVPQDKTLTWCWGRVEQMVPSIDLLLDDLKAWGDVHEGACQRLATVCEEYVRALSRRFGCSDVRSLRAIAFCLYYFGESIKQTVGGGTRCPYPALHALWKLASASGHEADMLSLPFDGTDRMSSIDRLYMRALVLAWGAGVGLEPAQLQVFDGWIWHWMTAIECSEQPPRGPSLRADPEAPFGLSTQPPGDALRHVHLSRRELESALRILSGELGAGRTVPPGECNSADLDGQRRTLAIILRALVASGGA